MQSLKIKRFDPKTMERCRLDPNKGPPTIIIIGSRGTGKTYLLKQLMYHFRKIPAGMIITGSEASAETFGEFFPRSFIYDEVDTERIEKIADTQTKLRKKKTEGDYSSCLIFDDCGYDKSITRKKIIKKIFCNGRHLKILLVMTVQYCKDIPPDLRSNADYVFILKENVQENKKKLWKEYAGIVDDFDTFNQIMNSCTDNRGVLVIDNTSISNDLTENLFWYRASPVIKPFKVGSASLWKFHEENYKSEDDSDDNTSGMIAKKKKPSIVIKKLKGKGKTKTKPTDNVKLNTKSNDAVKVENKIQIQPKT